MKFIKKLQMNTFLGNPLQSCCRFTMKNKKKHNITKKKTYENSWFPVNILEQSYEKYKQFWIKEF